MSKGRFAKFFLYGDDPAALADFYAKVFGWKVTRFKFGENLPEEVMVEAPCAGPRDKFVGNLSARDSGSPSNGFECVLWVTSLDRTALEIERHGGRVVYLAPFIKRVGGMLRFHDPAGNVGCAVQPLAARATKATSNKRMQLTRSAKANGRRGPRS